MSVQEPGSGGEGPEASTSSSQTLGGEKPKKQVQVVGAPPPLPFGGRKAEERDEDSGDDDEDAEEDEGEEDERDEEDGEEGREGAEARQNGREEVEEEDLLANFPEDEDTIDLTHLRLTTKALRRLPWSKFSKSLERLSMRQNEISKITEYDVGQLNALKELDLYDNGLEKTYGDVLKACPNLESLDYSFNSIRHISHLNHLANVHTLYFVQNKISRVRADDLTGPIGVNLRSLELGGNKLRSLEHIGHLTRLEELWVGKNKITKLENLSSLKSLRILSIQSNRLTKIEGLEALTNLEELYLSHNGLQTLEGLESNARLTTLDVGANRIEEIKGVSHLSVLEEFWANDNAITTIQSIDDQLGPNKCPKLNTVYLEGNPVQRSEGAAYRRKLMLALPQISQIDATFVKQAM